MTKLDARVLNYWEKEFGGFQAVVNASGGTFYSRKDVQLILEIKQWFLVERLNKEEIKKRIQPELKSLLADDVDKIDKKKLRLLKRELKEILTFMAKNDKNKP